ncbi:MAG: ShlB/FhaC/HecB family hemolysin secretion/activation protein [Burkholderiales bacterium]|nr:ShlB/FhaC/HecB family hemolysin secretion/activation protein [Burkholderiales bacterium]
MATTYGIASAASDDVIKGAPDTLKQPPQPLRSAPLKSAPGPSFVLPPVGSANAAAGGIQVAGFRFEGNSVFSTEELLKIAAPYSGRRVGVAELEDLRTRITRMYVDRGYINSGALLAAAAGPNGYPADIVPIRVIEGRIAEVRIKGEERLHKSYIESRLIKSDELLNVNTMQERFRMLTLDPLFDRINSRIIPGHAPGVAILDIDVVRAQPYGLTAFANNYRPPSIGSEGLGVSGWVRNLTGYGDVLDASLQHSEGSDPIRMSWMVPINSSGTTLRLSADHGKSSVIEEPLNTLDIRSLTTGYEIGLNHPLIDTLERKFDLGVSYGERKSETSLLGGTFSFTGGLADVPAKVKVIRLSQEWTERWQKQALALRSVFAFGSNNVDPASTIGTTAVADQHYTIWTGQVQFVNNLGESGAQIVLRGTVQATPNSLLPLERFSLGGVATVRGYRENSVVRDNAYFGSVEFHYPLMAGEEKRSLTLVSFVDFGRGWNKNEAEQKLSSAGLGLNWRWHNFSADLFWAKRLINLPIETSGNLQDKGMHFQISYKVF